ncbi:hypothetical protein PH586_18945 [Pseudomonas sp. SA3-5]|uniref:Uncharacterized protein n=1 Tax=Pseudomonas aestuarii TaxID=3018340 RepID=A0ABT4XJQ7_9PSED|nr:hypothetical protein [Pseudomonas aestuarii]MDA7088461.1 hypothetical protein [Pseudomonas aestuarii]
MVTIIALVTVVTVVAIITMATIIAIVTTNRHGYVADLAWCVTMAMVPVVVWCVMHHPLRLAVIMTMVTMVIVTRIMERRNQQRADGYACDYGNNLASLKSGGTACRSKTTGQ